MFNWLASLWVYWTVSLGLGALGLLTVLVGLFGSRWRFGSRGAQCCKCGYDMCGHVKRFDDDRFTCPECGHQHRYKHQLFHSPIRRGRVIVGILLCWAAAYLLFSPNLNTRRKQFDEPWYCAAVPTTVRILFWSSLDDESQARCLKQWRWLEGKERPAIELSRWQARWLIGKIEPLTQDADPLRRRDAMFAIVAIAGVFDPPLTEPFPGIRRALNDPDSRVRREALWGVKLYPSRVGPLVPTIVQLTLYDPDTVIRRWGMWQLEALPEEHRDGAWVPLMAGLPPGDQVSGDRIGLLRTLWALNPDRTAEWFLKHMAAAGEVDAASTLYAVPTSPETPAGIAGQRALLTFLKTCPPDQEREVLQVIGATDYPTCEALLAEFAASADPLLREKAKRLVEQLPQVKRLYESVMSARKEMQTPPRVESVPATPVPR